MDQSRSPGTANVGIPLVHRISIDDIQRGDHIYQYPNRPSKSGAVHAIYVGERGCEVIFLHKSGVAVVTLEEFLPVNANGQLPKVQIYRYGVSDVEERLKSSFLSMVSRHPGRNAEEVVEVAKWFAERPHTFLQTWPGDLHSKDFAIFCRTSKYTADELTRAHSFRPSRLPAIFKEHLQSDRRKDLKPRSWARGCTLVTTAGSRRDDELHATRQQSVPSSIPSREQMMSRPPVHTLQAHSRSFQDPLIHQSRFGAHAPSVPAPPLPDSVDQLNPPRLPAHTSHSSPYPYANINHCNMLLEHHDHPRDEPRKQLSSQITSSSSKTFLKTSQPGFGPVHQADGGGLEERTLRYTKIDHRQASCTSTQSVSRPRHPTPIEARTTIDLKAPQGTQDYCESVQGITSAAAVRKRSEGKQQSGWRRTLSESSLHGMSQISPMAHRGNVEPNYPPPEKNGGFSSNYFGRHSTQQDGKYTRHEETSANLSLSQTQSSSNRFLQDPGPNNVVDWQISSNSFQQQRSACSQLVYPLSKPTTTNQVLRSTTSHHQQAFDINDHGGWPGSPVMPHSNTHFFAHRPCDPQASHRMESAFPTSHGPIFEDVAKNSATRQGIQQTFPQPPPPPPPPPPPVHSPPPPPLPPKCSLPSLHPSNSFLRKPVTLAQPPLPPACPPPQAHPCFVTGENHHRAAVAQSQFLHHGSLPAPPPPLPLNDSLPMPTNPSTVGSYPPLNQQLQTASMSLQPTAKPMWKAPVKAVIGGLVGGVVGGVSGAILATGGTAVKEQEPIEQEKSRLG